MLPVVRASYRRAVGAASAVRYGRRDLVGRRLPRVLALGANFGALASPAGGISAGTCPATSGRGVLAASRVGPS